MNPIEIKITMRGEGGWEEHLARGTNEQADAWLEGMTNRHDGDTEGSYRILMRINDGVSKNPKTGATMVINMKSTLNGVLDIISLSRRKV